MRRTEKTFFRQVLLTRMLLEADPPSRAERRGHTRDPKCRGRCSGGGGNPRAPCLPYQGGTLAAHPASPPQPHPQILTHGPYQHSLPTPLWERDPGLKEAPLQTDRNLHSNKGAAPTHLSGPTPHHSLPPHTPAPAPSTPKPERFSSLLVSPLKEAFPAPRPDPIWAPLPQCSQGSHVSSMIVTRQRHRLSTWL